MSSRIIIDGYNFLGMDAGVLRDIESERDGLIERLRLYKKARRADVTVVFDGTHSGRLMNEHERRAGVEVVFSRDGIDADTVIRGLSDRYGAGATVVTSDNALASYAASRGAVVLSSPEFEGLLEAALYEELKGVKPGDEEDESHDRKGPSRRLPKEERKKRMRIKKL
ncbi:MAG: NYN domain-containing protein [Deltaproteobacteria bacterium]|nr:NYN domain-containing protein [Deltaproteobacteria bacterium]